MKQKNIKVSFLRPSFIITLFLVVLAFLVGYFLKNMSFLKKKPSVSFKTPSIKEYRHTDFTVGEIKEVSETDHIKGNKNARIALIEYGDTEGPFDKDFYSTLKNIVKKFPDSVVWVYRPFPNDDLFSKSRKEAEALECANKLKGNEGFWMLLEKIFSQTPSDNGLDIEELPDFAQSVGIGKEEFKKCLDSSEFKQKVEDSYQSGIKTNVTGTPQTILVDSKTNEKIFLPGNIGFEQLKEIIEKQLDK